MCRNVHARGAQQPRRCLQRAGVARVRQPQQRAAGQGSAVATGQQGRRAWQASGAPRGVGVLQLGGVGSLLGPRVAPHLLLSPLQQPVRVMGVWLCGWVWLDVCVHARMRAGGRAHSGAKGAWWACGAGRHKVKARFKVKAWAAAWTRSWRGSARCVEAWAGTACANAGAASSGGVAENIAAGPPAGLPSTARPPVCAHNGVAPQQRQQHRLIHPQRAASQRQHPCARVVWQLVCGAAQKRG